MNYYIADLHFGHDNAISFDHRPFETVEEILAANPAWQGEQEE